VRVDVSTRRFTSGCALLAGAALLAIIASSLPWLAASDEPGVARSGWDLFATFGVQITRTLPEKMFTGPVAIAAGVGFLGAVALLVVRRRTKQFRLFLLLGAISLVAAGAFMLLGVWRSVHDMSRRSCGCDPSSDIVVVHGHYGANLVGAAGILAIAGLAVGTVAPTAPSVDEGVNRPFGW
jgi:hypothetical protein